MNYRSLFLAVSCSFAVACAPNMISSQVDAGGTGGGTSMTTAGGAGGGDGMMTAGGSGGSSGGEQDSGMPEVDSGVPDAGRGPYPPPPYGVSVNRVIQNFIFPGVATDASGVKINTLPRVDGLDLQAVRNLRDPNGNYYRFMLLDISAGWCAPCNQEAQDLGLVGSKKALIDNWRNRGGLFFTVLVQGYDQSTGAPPLPGDLDTWANQHQVQTSLALDPMQNLIAQGINPSAFPTNLVVDLRTMRIVAAWYGLETTYQKWEAALNGP